MSDVLKAVLEFSLGFLFFGLSIHAPRMNNLFIDLTKASDVVVALVQLALLGIGAWFILKVAEEDKR